MKQRQGSKVIETIEHDAIIPFQTLLDKCEITSDDYQNAPWKECDGWEHTAAESPDYDGVESARGYVFRSRRDGGSVLIELDIKKSGIADRTYWHAQGASKQVSAELEAKEIRRAVDQLTEWYENGWEWYQVCLDFEGESASLCGIDDYKYADTDVRKEIALEVAHQLEKQGYTITDMPDSRVAYDAQRKTFARERVLGNVNRFNTSRR